MAASKFESAVDLRPLALDAEWSTPDVPPEDVVVGLFDACGPRLLTYVRAFGIGPDAAEDVVQDVFLALFRHLERGRSRRNLRGWVFRVAHNLALKHRQRVRAREAPVPAEDRRIDPGGTPEESYAADRRRQRVQAAFDALPERERQCVLLRAEGLRYRDIGRVLGLSLGTVANTLARAFSTLEVANEE